MSDPAGPESAVCITGPLIALAKIGPVGLLPKFFAPVLVPAGVFTKLSTAARLPEAGEIVATAGIERAVLDRAPDPFLLAELGCGEAEVIALAVARGIERVIIDERKGTPDRQLGVRPQGHRHWRFVAKRQARLSAAGGAAFDGGEEGERLLPLRSAGGAGGA